MARSFRFWLALGLSMLVALAVLTVVAALLGILLPRLNAEVEAKNRALGEATSLQVEGFLHKSENELERLAADIARHPGLPPEPLRVMLETLANADAQIEALYVVDPGDRVLEVGLPIELRSTRSDLIGIDFGNRAFVRSAREQRRSVWSDTYLSQRGRIVVALAIPQPLPGRAGEPAGSVLVAEFNLNELSRFARELGKAGAILSIIVDRRGQIVAHPDAGRSLRQENIRHLEPLREAPTEGSRSARFRLDNSEYIGSTTPVGGLGWTVLVAQPTDQAFATVRATLLALAAGSALSLSLALLAAVVASRRMSQRVAEFGRHMQAIAAGDYRAPIPKSGADEIESLAQSMRRMADAVLEREERLQQSEAKYRDVVEGTRDLIVRIDRRGRVSFANHMTQTYFGVPATACVGLTAFDFVHPDDRAATRAAFGKWLKSGCRAAVEFENRQLARDGAVHLMHWSVVADRAVAGTRDGEITGFSGIARDVTAERAAEQVLAASEERYRALFHNAPLAYQSLGMDTRILDVNDAWCRLFGGYTRDEVVGRPIGDFIAERSLATLAEEFPRFVAEGRIDGPVFEIRRKDGETRTVTINGRIDPGIEGERHTHCILSDVTEQLRIEAERRQAAGMLAMQAARAVAMLDLPAAAERLDEAAFMQYGLEVAERLTGSTISFIHFVNDDQQTIELVAWSRSTVENYCRASFFRHYPVGKAGIWADALRRGEPVVFNDYASAPGRHGLPADHAELLRLVSVPVLEGSRVRMLAGVGNKASAYDDLDVETVQLIAQEMWSIAQHKRAERKICESEARFRDVATISADWIWEVDTRGRYTYASESITRLLGYTPDEVIGKTAFELMPPGPAARIAEAFAAIVAQGIPFRDLENIVLDRDGKAHVTLTSGAPVRSADGTLVGYRGVDRDITERRRAEEAQRLAATVFSASAEGILITDAERRILSVNPALVAITGYAEGEVIGKTPAVFTSGRHDPQFYREMWACIARDGFWRGEIWNRRKNGEIFPEWLTVTAVRNARGVVSHYIGSFFDISERKQAEKHIEFLAHHDALTKLPNRTLLDDRIRQAIIKSRRSNRRLAVMFLDLDRFKLINDTLGHDVGDRLLEGVADSLRGVLRETETVARLGGDEFIIVIPELDEIDRAAPIARKIIDTVSAPFRIDDRVLHVTPSIGISIYPDDGDDPATLLRNADTAMYHAKERGRNNFQLFAPAMNQVVQERVAIENDLHTALERGEFLLHYQPQVDCRSGRILGMEALIRWQHPERGLVAPARFVGIAEETGLIVPIGAWVIDEACRQARRWHDAGHTALRVGVNLSARQFQDPGLHAQIDAAIRAAGIEPSALELELTESVLMVDPQAATAVLKQLAGLGVKMAIDDFGTGYSSLAYLKHFPVKRLKIDRSFVRDLSVDPNDAAIIDAVVAMAASLKLDVIAEGVETAEQLRYLASHGCHEIQGYYFSRPQAAEAFSDFRFESGCGR